MNIPTTQGYLTTTYDKLIRLLGEPNNGSLINQNKITVRWNFEIHGYKLYINNNDTKTICCEWYIGNKDITWLFNKNTNIIYNSPSSFKYNDNNNINFKNADNVIKSLIYYSE